MMEDLIPCPFCHHDRVGIVDQTGERDDGTEWRKDMAECKGCYAMAPLDLWARLVHFLKPIQALAKEVLHADTQQETSR